MSHTSKFAALRNQPLVLDRPVVVSRESPEIPSLFEAAFNCLGTQPRLMQVTESSKDLRLSVQKMRIHAICRGDPGGTHGIDNSKGAAVSGGTLPGISSYSRISSVPRGPWAAVGEMSGDEAKCSG